MLLALIALVVIVYLLGEQWGRESPSRTSQINDIIAKKADLKKAENNLSSTTTSAFFHLLIVIAVLVLIVLLFGGGLHDFGEMHRSTHRYR